MISGLLKQFLRKEVMNFITNHPSVKKFTESSIETIVKQISKLGNINYKQVGTIVKQEFKNEGKLILRLTQ
jgi:autonomous glycyl radical cofactor GrcA